MKSKILAFLFLPFLCFAQPRADILIKNGKIIDGTGNSWFYSDIAIRKGKIIAIGNLGKIKSKKVIDAQRHIVAPGFIDVHTHIEGDEKKTPTADNFILDGVTTVITGNCGSSNLDLKNYFRMLDSLKLSVNVATFIGHNSVRTAVLGTANRAPNPEELTKMKNLVENAMRDGAVGFSTGLIYIPGTYAKTDEVVSLAKVAAKYHGIYTSHIRSESQQVFTAIDEAINVGKEAGMPVQISHFKIGKPYWGQSDKTLAMIEKARAEGFDVSIDQYPYTASSTSLNSLIPSWALENGTDSILFRLHNPIIRKKIKDEMISDMEKRQRTNFEYAVVARLKLIPLITGKIFQRSISCKAEKIPSPTKLRPYLTLQKKAALRWFFIVWMRLM